MVQDDYRQLDLNRGTKLTVILRRSETLRRAGFQPSTLNYMVKIGRFPPPVKIGLRAVGWVEAEVEAHLQSLIEKRDCPQAIEAKS